MPNLVNPFSWLVLCSLITGSAVAGPFYLTGLNGAGEGTGTIELNTAQTGGLVNIDGSYTGAGSLLSYVLIGGALVPRDISSTSLPNFLYTGTIFFTQTCCSGDTVFIDDLGSLSGVWELVAPVRLGSPPPVTAPVPEIAPRWATLAGALLLAITRFRRARLHA